MSNQPVWEELVTCKLFLLTLFAVLLAAFHKMPRFRCFLPLGTGNHGTHFVCLGANDLALVSQYPTPVVDLLQQQVVVLSLQCSAV